MFRFVGVVARNAIGLITRRILRDALASAIVTIVVTAAFTGFATRYEPPVPAQVARAATPPLPPRPRIETAVAVPADDTMKVWLDPNAVTPNPMGFQRATSASASHSAPRKRSAAAAARPAPATPPRVAVQASRAASPGQASGYADDKALGHRHAPDALAMAAPAPERRGFRVWGVAPGDLIPSVPSASSIVKSVKSVGSSVVSWMPSL